MKKVFSIPTTILFMLITALITLQLSSVFIGKSYKEQYRNSIITNGATTEKITGDSKTGIKDLVTTLGEIDTLVQNSYVGKINAESIKNYAIYGYLAGLGDKYANYMDKEEYASSMSGNEGHMVGIGINVITDNTVGGIYVINVTKNGPAEKAGILPSDIITQVDGKSVKDLGYYKTVQYIKKGNVGDTLKMTVLSSPDYAAEKTVTVSRETIDIKTVQGEMATNDIGMIKISEFNRTTPDEFTAVIKSLQDKGAKKYIFDVRNNPGGDLLGIKGVLDYLLPKGPIVRIVDKNKKEEVLYSDENELKAPMTVLINGNTASAAELFSSALRDYKKATLIGTKTYGKGTMQTVVPLPNGGGLSISTAMYNPPFGDNYEGVGVSPNIELEMPKDLADKFYKLTNSEDPQISKAIEVLNSNK